VNDPVFNAALRAGCTRRQAEVLATYVDAETIDDAAEKLGISARAVLQHLRLARLRLNVAHNTQLAVAVLLTPADIRSTTAAR
jgi:DNA-binding CsgD family transcriptional regulator